MKKLTLHALIAMPFMLSLATGINTANAQQPLQRPQTVVPLDRAVQTARPVPRRVENLRNMILLNDPQSIKAVQKIELGRFWIGLNCAEVSPALRSQLKLKDGTGLLVVNAFEGSPSQKAGLQQHDVVIKANDANIGAVGQLIEAVQKAGESELKLEIIRAGESQTVHVQSAERPTEQLGKAFYFPQVGGEHPLLFRAPEGAFTFVEPGIVLDNGFNWTAARTIDHRLPEGVSITITRKAGEKTSIQVKQDNRSWDITPDQIDELPHELRPHVQSMLRPVHLHNFWSNTTGDRASRRVHRSGPQDSSSSESPDDSAEVKSGDSQTKRESDSDNAETEIEKLKQELKEEIRQLREAINKLRK